MSLEINPSAKLSEGYTDRSQFVIPLTSICLGHALDEPSEIEPPTNLFRTIWFIVSFLASSFGCLLYYSGAHSPIIPIVGESIASLRPPVLLTPLWAALTYLIAITALPRKQLGMSSLTAMVSGCVSFYMLAVAYDQFLVPYLAEVGGRTEFEQDTWTGFYLAMVVCVIIGLAIECSIVRLATVFNAKQNVEPNR